MKTKRVAISGILDRISEANAAGFHLEAALLSGAIIEDRQLSILKSSGGLGVAGDGSEIRMLGPKTSEIEIRQGASGKKVKLLELAYDVTRVRAWTEKRNKVVHKLLENPRPFDDVAADAKWLGEEGESIARELLLTAARLKKKNAKALVASSAKAPRPATSNRNKPKKKRPNKT